MTYNNAKLRSAMTATVAVFALSSAPLFAQDVSVPDPAPDTTSEPVTETPDPLAPEPAAPKAPVVTETDSQPAKSSEPAAKAKAATRQSAPAARPSATRSPAAGATAPAAIPTPAAEELIDTPVATPGNVERAAPPAAIPTDTAVIDQAQEMDDMLELAGAAGVGLFALAGAVMALRRRRHRKEEERVEEAKWAIIEAAPDLESEVEREPAFTRTPAPIHDPVPPARTPAHGPAAKLPDGFDPSRFGPHVQAAYRGPTPDNPSVSLQYRLRRASGFDQQEQHAKEAAARAAKVPAKGNWESRPDADFLFRRAEAKNSAKPAYQR